MPVNMSLILPYEAYGQFFHLWRMQSRDPSIPRHHLAFESAMTLSLSVTVVLSSTEVQDLDHRSRKSNLGVYACALKHPEILVERISVRAYARISNVTVHLTREFNSLYGIVSFLIHLYWKSLSLAIQLAIIGVLSLIASDVEAQMFLLRRIISCFIRFIVQFSSCCLTA